jgi:hypothetical protein
MGRITSFALRSLLGPVLVLVSLFAAGCGGSDNLASVHGTVTLDGEPLAGAKVEFEFRGEEVIRGKSTGSASYGKTDAQGRYTLAYTPDKEGAPIGEHTVRITTREMKLDANGKEVLIPERLPPQYHVDSKLAREVKPGSNTIDFDLTLQPPTAGAQ